MRRILIRAALFFGVLALIMASGCKSSGSSGSTGITKFTFKASDNAPDINQITYTVDTVAGTITNYDSIAYTSVITQVVPVVTLGKTVSEIRINDVAWNQTDSIDVSSEFKLTIISANKKYFKDYTVRINKHTVNPDSIVWQKIDHDLPAGFTGGRALYTDDIFLFIGERDGSQETYMSTDCTEWTMLSQSDPVININTAYATRGFNLYGGIYALSLAGDAIYTYNSIEGSFEKTVAIEGFTATDIIGEYQDEILILAKKDGNSAILTYKDGAVTEKKSSYPSSFPVAGGFARLLVKYDEETTANVESTFLIGGETSQGVYTTGVHATDNGWYWSNILKTPSSSYFTPMSYSAAVQYCKKLYTFGGVTNSSGTEFADNQISSDNGFTWSAPANYQKVPDAFTPKYGISAIAADDGDFYIMGGFNSGKTYVLDFYKGRVRSADFLIP